MITIKRYDSTTDRERWNQFVAQSKQATFLLHRSYMDYHSDRFHDHSLMISATTNSMPCSLPMRTETRSILTRDLPMPD